VFLKPIGVPFLRPRPLQNKSVPEYRSEYNVYSTFQSHEPEFDYLKSLEIEEKINKIRWLPQKNASQFLLSTNGRWLVSFVLHFNPHLQLFNELSTVSLCHPWTRPYLGVFLLIIILPLKGKIPAHSFVYFIYLSSDRYIK
jgi:hypothetical protein